MQVTLDAELCIGSGSCEQIAPEVFRMAEDGEVTVIAPNPPEELSEAVQEAALNCPTSAITVTA